MSFVIYIKNHDDPAVLERSEELPGVYPNRLEAMTAITAFSNSAADSGFHYPVTDFEIRKEQSMPESFPVYSNGDNEQPTVCPMCGTHTEFSDMEKGQQLHTCLNEQCNYQFILDLEDDDDSQESQQGQD